MSNQTVYKTDVLGIANGIIFMAFFGTVWASVGIIGLRELGTLWLLGIAVSIGVFLFILGMRVFASSKHAAVRKSPESKSRDKKIRLGFNLTFAAEIALIALAAFVLGNAGYMEWFFPVMCFIVGAHFFPLAFLFREKVHYITGTLLCLLAAATVLFLPQSATIGSYQITAWAAVVGFGAALILWATAFSIWRSGLPLLKQLQN
ncbi:hypothetical protein [Planomicrobium sp. CPCC 101079]|uniref:DUF7010 family protein n=1 Tax=Planomicrobium sp. CPCC 101079 TaxID=2599618 RepID=UPI0011B7B537|nr:hypothetical protein [Planomicrobium sp. CPCC 101079]TWT01613.1 hypothetical protein FQV28_16215 [Planomicrobium sp. CPCC 101079]